MRIRICKGIGTGKGSFESVGKTGDLIWTEAKGVSEREESLGSLSGRGVMMVPGGVCAR